MLLKQCRDKVSNCIGIENKIMMCYMTDLILATTKTQIIPKLIYGMKIDNDHRLSIMFVFVSILVMKQINLSLLMDPHAQKIDKMIRLRC